MNDKNPKSSGDNARHGVSSAQFKERVRHLAGKDVDLPTIDAAQHLQERKSLYDSVNQTISGLRFGKFVYFMNFGYIANDTPTFAPVLPRDSDFDANSRRLVLEVIGDCPVAEKDVLDVSCGRGALAVVLSEQFQPRSYVGVDYSEEAIAFCQDRHTQDGYRFVEGSAESLPCGDESVDVVVNIEASHLYPDYTRFFKEVHRVLRPDGWFQYTDAMSPDSFERGVGVLSDLGLQKTRDVDITRNVLLSCERLSERRLCVYTDPEERALMAEFLCAPGSEVYSSLDEGSLRYRLYTFRKPVP